MKTKFSNIFMTPSSHVELGLLFLTRTTDNSATHYPNNGQSLTHSSVYLKPTHPHTVTRSQYRLGRKAEICSHGTERD